MVKRMKTQGFYHIGRLLLRSPMLLILLALLPAPATAGPAVVASIKPIHSLVANLMQGAGEPTLLVRAGGSPHGYNLRPSEVHNLEAADLVVWVGPQLESFMVRPLANLELNGHLLTLLEQPEMKGTGTTIPMVRKPIMMTTGSTRTSGSPRAMLPPSPTRSPGNWSKSIPAWRPFTIKTLQP